MDDQTAILSDAQKQCLRLAAEGRSSKEIAPVVGLTHHTVDQYLRRATIIMGAENRRDAARRFLAIEQAAQFKGFELKSPDVAQIESSGISGELTKPLPPMRQRLGLPPSGGPPNDLTLSQRLTAIGRIALFLMIVIMAMVIIVKGAFIVLS